MADKGTDTILDWLDTLERVLEFRNQDYDDNEDLEIRDKWNDDA